ncbi:TetR/AcrR family transcriptional regulator [Sphingosinithalassobacter portus]|uniref:TetR/AcrR family transcriptional regulator n=1 Tax=Stakelama portus TaxID=2676234 RepID=UPI00137A63D2|nr:TetR/AcrR family transcriptional regulator [Sphingosinithalassobacter portus]
MARPSKPLISRRGAAEAALAVIDEVGLEKLSLSQVAQRLGVRSPSLYYHFRDKDALLEEVARLLLLEIRVHLQGQASAEEWIVSLCVSARRTLLAHPNAAPLMLRFFPRKLLLRAYDRWTKTYDYPPEAHMAVIEGTEKLTFGSALFAAAAAVRGEAPMPPIDAHEYPQLGKALESNPFDEEQLFIETLRMFLAGVRARIEQGSLGRPLSHAGGSTTAQARDRRSA